MSQVRKDVLNGWKEIAAYLGRDPRTVERWEKQRSLPVRRLPGSGRATVYALVAELDAWLSSGPPREPDGKMPEPMPLGASVQTETEGGRTANEVDRAEPKAPDAEARAEQGAPLPAATGSAWWKSSVGSVVVVCVGLLLGVGVWWFVNSRHADPVNAGSTLPRTVGGRPHTLVPVSAVSGVEQLYMRGCYQTEQRTPESLSRAQEAFRTVLAKDPGYAPAYAGMATTYILLREYATLPDDVAYAEARKAAAQALARDPDLPQAHAVLGFVDFFWDWHPEQAEKEFQSALRADPELALTHHWYGSMLTHEGRFADGLQELEAAQRLEPTSAAILTTRALALGMGGRRDEATELLEEAVSTDKAGRYRNPATMHNVLGMLSLIGPRNLPRYLSETLLAAELRQDTHGVEVMRMANEVYMRKGEQAMWQALLEDERRRNATGAATYAMARLEAETGAHDKALQALSDLYTRHDPALIGLAIDPLLAPLRGEPRFTQLRTAVGFPTTSWR